MSLLKKVLFLLILLSSVSFAQQKDILKSPIFSKQHLVISKRPQSFQKTNIKDLWIAEDKARHLVGSFILAGIFSQSLKRFSGLSNSRSINLGFSISLGIGLAKEINDGESRNNIFSIKDLGADILGATLGYFIFR